MNHDLITPFEMKRTAEEEHAGQFWSVTSNKTQERTGKKEIYQSIQSVNE